jgi:methyl-accepting chemotaxis protein
VSSSVRQVETVIFSGGESSKEAGKIFDTIRRDLGTYAAFVQELAVSIREQLTANRDMTGSMTAIGTVVDLNADAAALVSRIISDLKAEMVKLDALLGDHDIDLRGPAPAGDAEPLPLPGSRSSSGWRALNAPADGS